MDGHQIGGVARAIPAAPASAHSAGNLAPLRLRQDDAATSATARAGFAVFRVRTGSPAAAAYSVQACVVYRLRPLAAPGTAHSTGNLLPGYKGWNWQPLNAWEGPASPAPDNPQPGEQPDLDAVWQRVVQWQ